MEMITLVNWKTVLSIAYIAKMQILVIIAEIINGIHIKRNASNHVLGENMQMNLTFANLAKKAVWIADPKIYV